MLKIAKSRVRDRSVGNSKPSMPESWDGKIPVIEILEPCGVRSSYVAGMAAALRTKGKVIMSVATSGAAIPGALLQAGATPLQIQNVLASSPTKDFTSLPTLERWLDDTLRSFGIETWRDMRFSGVEAGDDPSRWTHRLQFQVVATRLPERLGDELAEHQDELTARHFRQIITNSYLHTGHSPRFQQVSLPQDAPPSLGIDDLPVSWFAAASCANPLMWGPKITDKITWGNWTGRLALSDGGVQPFPNPFNPRFMPPMPVVELGIDAMPKLSMGRREFLRISGRYNEVGSLDFDKVDAETQRQMFEAGFADALVQLDRYFDRYAASFEGFSPADPFEIWGTRRPASAVGSGTIGMLGRQLRTYAPELAVTAGTALASASGINRKRPLAEPGSDFGSLEHVLA